MKNKPSISEKQKIRVGPHLVPAVISKVFSKEDSGADCEVVYVWQGKELYENVQWNEDKWEFMGGAGYADLPRFKPYLNVLKDTPMKS